MGSTLAEPLFGIRLAHASSCKAAARSEDDFFMSSVFLPWVQLQRLSQAGAKGSRSLNGLDADLNRSIRFNLTKSLKQYVRL